MAQMMERTMPLVRPLTMEIPESSSYMFTVFSSLIFRKLMFLRITGPTSTIFRVRRKITTIRKQSGIRDFQFFLRISPAVSLSNLISISLLAPGTLSFLIRIIAP